MKENNTDLLWFSFQRALVGSVTSNMRLITVSLFKGHLHLIAYFDSPVVEEDRENISNIAAEVLSDLEYNSENLECLFDERPLNNLPVLEYNVYVRSNESFS